MRLRNSGKGKKSIAMAYREQIHLHTPILHRLSVLVTPRANPEGCLLNLAENHLEGEAEIRDP